MVQTPEEPAGDGGLLVVSGGDGFPSSAGAATGAIPAASPSIRGPAPGTVRLRARVAYDGTDFHGWARQPDRRTVAGELEGALGVLLRLPAPRTVCAGRTDAGVHATAQHVHVDVPVAAWQRVAESGERAGRRLNGLLPDDIGVRSIGPAPEGFDARFSVLHREYTYEVADAIAPDPLRRRQVLAWRAPLDLDRLQQAAGLLLGEHDFGGFCKRRPEGTTVRTLLALDWRRTAQGTALMTIRADAFCHSMVRSVVGAMLVVGDGRRDPGWLAGVLRAAVRTPEVVVAPPHALVLSDVVYPSDGELAAQAVRARRTRRRHPASDGLLP